MAVVVAVVVVVALRWGGDVVLVVGVDDGVEVDR